MKSVLLRSCPCSPFLFESHRGAHPQNLASTVRCASRNQAYIPKLEPFSRSKFDRAIKGPTLIEKCENELSGTYGFDSLLTAFHGLSMNLF